MFERYRRELGDTFTLRFGPYKMVVINRPEDIRHVLVKNHANYHKSPTYELLRPVLGNGLITSEGQFWRRQRKLAQPAFHHKSLIGFADTMTRLSLELADEWADAPRGIDAHAAMMNLTLRIVGHTLMSTEFGGEASAIGKALTTVLGYVGKSEAQLILPKWFPLPGKYKAERATKELNSVVLRLIEERRESVEDHYDLLSMFMAATDDDDGAQMTDEQLRDELMTMILAGHETTANALSWTWYLLSRHPEVARKLRDELDEVLQGRAPTLADLAKLEYTECVIKESMRLFPPVWIVERQALADDNLGGYQIKKGTIVAISPWLLHHDETTYPNPDAFDPERFRPSAAADRDRYAYLPFSIGPRTCIGNAFAMMESKIILAVLAQRFDVAMRPGQTVTPEAGVTLRPKPAIWVDAVARAQ